MTCRYYQEVANLRVSNATIGVVLIAPVKIKHARFIRDFSVFSYVLEQQTKTLLFSYCTFKNNNFNKHVIYI